MVLRIEVTEQPNSDLNSIFKHRYSKSKLD